MTENVRNTSIKTRDSCAHLHNIYLIGSIQHQIIGAKLPSNRQVLQVMFYNMRIVCLTAQESANLTIDATEIFWRQARIPTRRKDKCVQMLVNLYETWKLLRKTPAGRKGGTAKHMEEAFEENLDDLFDIATADALESIKIIEDRQFLEMQRQKGRQGSMAGVDMVLYQREQRILDRRDKEAARKRKYDEEELNGPGKYRISSLFRFRCLIFNKMLACTQILDTDDNEANIIPQTPGNDHDIEAYSSSVRKRGRKSIITPRLVAALDNAKLSDGMAAHILISVAEAFGNKLDELAINRSTIHRKRTEMRLKEFGELQANFSNAVIRKLIKMY